MKRSLAMAVTFCMLYGGSVQAEPVPLPANPEHQRVVDTTGALTHPELAALMARSDDIDKRTGAVVLAVVVPTTGEETISQYALRIGEAWHPGHAGDERAAILVIAKNDKHIFISTTRVMSGKLTDAVAGRITRQMGEQAIGKKAGSNYYKGLNIFFDEVSKYIPEKQPTLAAPPTPVAQDDDAHVYWLFGMIAVVLSLGGIFWWLESVRKKAKREAEYAEAQAEAERRYQERERSAQRIHPTRVTDFGSAVPSPSRPTPMSKQTFQPTRTTARRAPTPTPTPSSRHSSLVDDALSVAAGVAIGSAFSGSSRSRSRDDDDSSSSSSSSSYDSGGSSSSFDSGGGGSSFD